MYTHPPRLPAAEISPPWLPRVLDPLLPLLLRIGYLFVSIKLTLVECLEVREAQEAGEIAALHLTVTWTAPSSETVPAGLTTCTD
jgi:hypothetical protein